MVENIHKVNSSQEDIKFQQAIAAIHAENFTQAREMLTELLKQNPQNPDYWVWMSAAMESQKERLYCLQAAYKLDPTNAAARRGLTILDEIPSGEPLPAFVIPQSRLWESRPKNKNEQPEVEKLQGLKKHKDYRLGVIRRSRIAHQFLWCTIVILLIAAVITVNGLLKSSTAKVIPPTVSLASVTLSPTVEQGQATLTSIRPLVEQLEATYTPTPIYAATPHGEAASDIYHGAMKAYESGQWELVGDMMAQIATAQPGSADALYFVGEADRLRGKFKEAVSVYSNAIQVNPIFAPSYLGRARSNIALNNPKDILADLNMAVQLDPLYQEAYLERGVYFLNTGDLNRSKSDLEHALSIKDTPQVEINMAKLFLAKKESGAAVVAAKQANRMDITMLEGYLVLGMALKADDQIPEAIQEFETYLAYQTDNAQAYIEYGSIFFFQGDFQKAEENFSRAVQLESDNIDGYNWLGKTYLSMNENDQAVNLFIKALETNPKSFDFYESLANTYLILGKSNPAYQTILKSQKYALTPALQARFLFMRAQAFDQLGDPRSALRDWNKILEMPIGITGEDMRSVALQRVNLDFTPTPTP